MAKLEPGLAERLVAVERDVAALTQDVNQLSSMVARVAALEGRLNERDRQESLFWSKYGVYVAIVAAVAGVAVGLLTVFATIGKL